MINTCSLLLIASLLLTTGQYVRCLPDSGIQSKFLQLKGQDIIAIHKDRLAAAKTPPRHFVYSCSRQYACGGLGDRFKGFVSTWVLALLLDAHFAVRWVMPVPIQKFYNLPASHFGNVSYKSCANPESWFWNQQEHFGEVIELQQTDFGSLWEEKDCIGVNLSAAVWNRFISNKHLWKVAEVYGLHKLSKRQVFAMAMQLFFSQPRGKLAARLSELPALAPTQHHIGVQMRFGGRWGDGHRYSAPWQYAVGCFVAETVKACEQIAAGRGARCSVFVTTDNPEASALFQIAMEAHSISVSENGSAEENEHIENSTGADVDFSKTFADWHILTTMDRLIASRSGFGETASWAGNVPAKMLYNSQSCLFTDWAVDVPEGADPHNPI